MPFADALEPALPDGQAEHLSPVAPEWGATLPPAPKVDVSAPPERRHLVIDSGAARRPPPLLANAVVLDLGSGCRDSGRLKEPPWRRCLWKVSITTQHPARAPKKVEPADAPEVG